MPAIRKAFNLTPGAWESPCSRSRNAPTTVHAWQGMQARL
jgi:hypothetical protein